MSASSSSGERVTIIGRRPMNSGMRPNLSRSSGCSCAMISSLVRSLLPRTSAPKPMTFLPMRLSMILSMPSKAPPQMNSMFVVSIWIKS